jgi:hypothetical protein
MFSPASFIGSIEFSPGFAPRRDVSPVVQQLLAAGADVVIPDYRDAQALLELILN